MNEPQPKVSAFPEQPLLELMRGIGRAARSASLVLALAPTDTRIGRCARQGRRCGRSRQDFVGK